MEENANHGASNARLFGPSPAASDSVSSYPEQESFGTKHSFCLKFLAFTLLITAFGSLGSVLWMLNHYSHN